MEFFLINLGLKFAPTGSQIQDMRSTTGAIYPSQLEARLWWIERYYFVLI